MNRRKFLAGLIGAIVAPNVVARVSLDAPKPETTLKSPFTIDWKTGNIRYTGDEEQTYSVLEFHHWLQEQLEQPENLVEPNASRRHTNNHIEILKPYDVCPSAVGHLRDGSIKTHDSLYTSISI